MPKAKRAASAESRNGSTQGGSKKNVASLHVLQRYLPEDLSVTRAALIVAIGAYYLSYLASRRMYSITNLCFCSRLGRNDAQVGR